MTGLMYGENQIPPHHEFCPYFFLITAESEDEDSERRSQRRSSQNGKSSSSAPAISEDFLFGIIFSRCRDQSATVRAKALDTLAKITAANNRTMAKVIAKIFTDDSRPGSQVGDDDG